MNLRPIRLDEMFALTRQALRLVTGRGRIPVKEQRLPGVRPQCASRRPDFDVVESESLVSVSFRVPGATADNTLLVWDEDLHTLGLRVELARVELANGTHTSDSGSDWYAEVVLPKTVDGSRFKATLSADTLLVKAPQRDTPALTGLPLFVALGGAISAQPSA
jgi:HSP20 family molecular chaperone IbpA